MKVSVIVLTWNGKEDTTQCLESIGKSQIPNFKLQIIVVDNGSTDGTQKAVKKLFIQIGKSPNISCKLIENRTNLGFAEGNNVGMKDALQNGADYVMLLNNDTIVDKNLVNNLVKEIKKHPTAGVISPKIYFAKGYEFHGDRYKKSDLGKVIWYAGGDMDWDNIIGSNRGVDEVDVGQFNKVVETDFATGTCMFLTRIAIDTVGIFDKKYFMYYEDTDLSVRMKKAGFNVLYVPIGSVWHKVAQSSGIGSRLNDYFTTRNRLLFGMRHASLRTRFALYRESLRFIWKGRKWLRHGAVDFHLRKFGKGSWK